MASQDNDQQSETATQSNSGEQFDIMQDVGSFCGFFLRALASLRLTVVMFLLAIFIVLAGTFAQVDKDIWEVIQLYFRVDTRQLFTSAFPFIDFKQLFVWIEPELFFPISFFPEAPVFPDSLQWMKPFWPHGTPNFRDWVGMWCPKGWVIGTVMMLNLIAAHLIRFKVQAKGQRLWAGWITIGLGAIITYAVIVSGSNHDGLQSSPLISYEAVRSLLLASFLGLAGVSIYSALKVTAGKAAHRWLYGSLAILLIAGGVSIYQWDSSDDAAMRILYQLVKATFASLVLLVGAILVFKRRAGVVVLHAGIGLMMFYDVLVGVRHVESQMRIEEGETVNFSRDIRTAEFAVIDPSDPDQDTVTVIPGTLLANGAEFDDKRLPFHISILTYMKNSDLRAMRSFAADEAPDNPATAGIGQQFVALPMEGSSGTDTGGSVDIPSAYVKLTSPDGNDLGTYLVTAFPDVAPGMLAETQAVKVDGQTYQFALRYQRLYKDYSIKLTDVQRNLYKGTERPKDYSSYIEVHDPERDIQFEHRIWMNNPMRYGGETFYQSSFIPAGSVARGSKEITVLQVVSNEGWMTPYVSCMIVVVGMIFHFGLTLLRFLDRRVSRLAATPNKPGTIPGMDSTGTTHTGLDQAGWLLAGVMSILMLSVIGSHGNKSQDAADTFQLSAFGELPIWYKGRPMPIDTFARNSLLQLADRETYKDDEDETQPALKWLIQVMSDEDQARDMRTIRIENQEVLAAVGLERRPGLTYTVNELAEKQETLIEQAVAAGKVDADHRSLYQRKVLELANKLIFYNFLESTLGRIPELPESQAQEPAARAMEYLRLLEIVRDSVKKFASQNNLGPLPLFVPTHLAAGDRPQMEAFQTDWEALSLARIYRRFYGAFERETPPAIEQFCVLLDNYRDGNVAKFNENLTKYEQLLRDHQKEIDLPLAKVNFEASYNRYDAFTLASFMYVFAFILAGIGWLGWPQVFQRAAFWTILTIFLIHTAALMGRVYISGRPPVTNLYSSAVFIGWAVVAGGLILEVMSRLGVGNVIAAMAGFLTLRIADGLATDGDTFVVLEAVLDTQFWLATHVVCITLGYSTTFLAGLLGMLYICLGLCTPSLSPRMSKEITRMTYGVLCFATFFSFFGTVLGGLWADDSWGRFWGWDPKENGALIIVLWNALVLHARWGAMVKERGLAILVVLGNIVVSWSWFGVNELGVGLHSYGFTEGRLAMLVLFALSQLTIAGIGCLPKALWLSSRYLDEESPVAID